MQPGKPETEPEIRIETADAYAEAEPEAPLSSEADVEPSPEPEPEPEPLPADGRELLHRLAVPRLCGSAMLQQLQRLVHDRLEALGYVVERRTFPFSPVPGRFALAAAGAVLAVLSIVAAVLLGFGMAAAAIGVLGVAALLILALALTAIPLGRRLRWRRMEGVNLDARPDGKQPRFIIMAHLDSKSQFVPLALRGPAILLAVLGWFALLVLAIVALLQPVSTLALVLVTLVAVVAGVLLALSWADDKSPGALDNASGVAALLLLAERERTHGDVGFLVTDAEELGLLGARALAGHIPPVYGVINLDGLDDHGPFHIMERFGPAKKGLAPHLAVALLTAADDLNADIRRRDLPMGVLVDHIPIVQGGQPAVTLMRGNWKSLSRVHRTLDSMDTLRGDGVDATVELVSRALAHMRASSP
jgi:hypothetical protein